MDPALPGPLSNRLHLLFAFVVVGFATLTISRDRKPGHAGTIQSLCSILMA